MALNARIILVDDHPIVRQGLKTLIELELDCTVVAEADNGLEALRLTAQMKPDLLVIDLLMPGMNGLDVARRVRQQVPDTRVMVLSMHADDAYVREALKAGASAYVLKEAKASEFIHAIREVLAGRRYLSHPLAERVIDTYLVQPNDATFERHDSLTAREQEILLLTALGHTAGEIAEQLGIGVRTVESHRTSVMRKLELKNQTDLIRFAIKRGIIPLDG